MEEFAEIWARSSGAELLLAMAQGRVPVPPHASHVGLKLLTVDSGRLEMAWKPGAPLLNPGGTVHGGYVSMVLDDAAGLSCATLEERFRPMLTLDLQIDFFKPVFVGQDYRLHGTVVHRGSLRSVADARIVTPDGKTLARARGSFTPNQSFDPTRS